MEVSNLNFYKKGWFIGDFEPSLIKSKNFEISIKRYKENDYEPLHHHKIAKEITIVIEGKAIMKNVVLEKNDIMILEPNEESDFKCLSDTTILVIKMPSIPDDKYLN